MPEDLEGMEAGGDEQMLDSLVQDLFLALLRRELEAQKVGLEQNGDALSTLNRTFIKENGKLSSVLETINGTLEAQMHELDDAREETKTQYRELLNFVAKSWKDAAAQCEALTLQLAGAQQQSGQSLGEQLARISQHISRMDSDMQTKLVAQDAAMNRQLAIQNEMQNRRLTVMQDSFNQQWVAMSETLNRQLVAIQEKQHTEADNNQRWRRWGVGLMLVNSIILAGFAVLFKLG